jgi:hypothetical protein
MTDDTYQLIADRFDYIAEQMKVDPAKLAHLGEHDKVALVNLAVEVAMHKHGLNPDHNELSAPARETAEQLVEAMILQADHAREPRDLKDLRMCRMAMRHLVGVPDSEILEDMVRRHNAGKLLFGEGTDGRKLRDAKHPPYVPRKMTDHTLVTPQQIADSKKTRQDRDEGIV